MKLKKGATLFLVLDNLIKNMKFKTITSQKLTAILYLKLTTAVNQI